MATIGIICAVPQESGPIIRRIPGTTRSRLQRLRAWQFTSSGHGVTLLESGMGAANARRAAALLIEEIKPDLIINTGFCGAITPGLAVGDLVVAEHVQRLTTTGLQQEASPLTDYFDTAACVKGTFISIETAVTKESLRPLLPGGMNWPVLEMETAFVARACTAAGIRFAAIRSVSDTADEEPYHAFQAITVNQFDITAASVIAALLRQPSLVLQLFRLGRNAAKAGTTLATQLPRILEQIP
jgi:adenosylhomocysteine nucleosidase